MDLFFAFLSACLSIGVLVLLYRLKKAEGTNEFKELFELAAEENKEKTTKVEALLEEMARKDVLMDRSAQAMEQAIEKYNKLSDEKVVLDNLLKFQEGQYASLVNQKKSSEVRTGMIAEQMAPFLDNYPLPAGTARFIGDPIDFVHFDQDKITFVEVKSGKSQLNKRQRAIRDLVKSGKIDFVIYRVEGNDEPDKG